MKRPREAIGEVYCNVGRRIVPAAAVPRKIVHLYLDLSPDWRKAALNKALILALAGAFMPSFASAQANNPAIDTELRLVRAQPLPLDSVRLTGGPLKHAQDLELEYLLALEPDRMLAYLRRSARLEPKAQGYGGWDGDGRQLTGHIAGHYLSGVSLAFAATGDTRFKERSEYIVS